MKLRNYQEVAVAQICKAMEISHKLKVEISTGLGRYAIITTLSQIYVNNKFKVLVLTSNRNICYQLRELFLEREDEKYTDVALYIKDYVEHNLLITTYQDLKKSENFNVENFSVVICDGIHYLDEKTIERNFREKNIYFIGFTSLVDTKTSGWFSDAKCVFRYTVQDAIQDGYNVKGCEFEAIVFKIFKKHGYSVDILTQGKDAGYDLRADKEEKHFAIEVKLWDNASISDRIVKETATRVMLEAGKENRIPMLVIANPDPERIRKRLSSFEKIAIIDIQNLLFMVQGDSELEDSLISVLDYSLGDLRPIPPAILLDSHSVKNEEPDISHLIDIVRCWDSQKESSNEYEKLCYKVLRILFAGDLTLWSQQEHSNEELFRFDLICKIKNGNTKDFWKMAEEYFKSKYIVFEFKNYKGQITQKEIFTTEKYLYLKALRGVAIIISANGADKHAEKAIRGILREEGKLIINLSNYDMVEMLKIKIDNEDPADYLSSKLDKLLIDLEK